MCTVTFFPLTGNRFLLSSNRDERTTRIPATPPIIKRQGNHNLIYPKDPQGGGTWIAADNRGNAVCLLNGALKPHKPEYPYRHSRGLVVLDFFNFNNIYDFIDLYDLNNIEPFTLVMVHQSALYEFSWNGSQRFLKNHNINEPNIWSSVTLYSPDIIRKRESWYSEWLQDHKNPDQDDIIKFHQTAGEGNKNIDVLMERTSYLKTVSITSILHDTSQICMVYKDMISGQKDKMAVLELTEE